MCLQFSHPQTASAELARHHAIGFGHVRSSVSEYPLIGTRISDLSVHGDRIPARKNWRGGEFGSWSEGIQSAMVGEHGCEAPAGSKGSGAKSSRI